MFERVLIANRGEIACRIIDVAKELDIATIAIYSDNDSASMHAKKADVAVRIAGNSVKETYMDANKIIEIALRYGVQAIHPGYGFLSENSEFAKKCYENNIKFIGPNFKVIETMGSKSKSKKLLEESGIPVIKGYYGNDQSLKTLKNEANIIGYPIIIKATHGGGGRGMRIANNSNEFASLLKQAQNEGELFFNSSEVILEKYLTNPRHIEVQIFSDSKNNTVHLFERDCSIQRRHQKVLEESPAPNLDNLLRKNITETAVKIAKLVKYEGAGTIEFLVDSNNFYFMEMNTRLQVEAPVTEMVTGINLIEWQFLIAAGNKLPLPQTKINVKGHSLECRIYSEDPENNFMPSTGIIDLLNWPEEDESTRIDTGIEQGTEITPNYDAMLAKIITYGNDRNIAINNMLKALNSILILGIKTNIKFLKNIITNESFMNGNFSTSFIEKEQSKLITKNNSLPLEALELATKYIIESRLKDDNLNVNNNDTTSPWREKSYWRLTNDHEEKITFIYKNKELDVFITYTKDEILLDLPEELVEIGFNLDDGYIFEKNGVLNIILYNEIYEITLNKPKYAISSIENDDALCANMPGTIIKTLVNKGDKVKKGDELITIEAMKMEQTFTAPYSGIIKEIYFKSGDIVSQNDLLIEIKR